METDDPSRFSNEEKPLMEMKSKSKSKSASEIYKNQRFSSCPFVHNQVLKIREEDSHLGEDIGEGLSKKDKVDFLHLSSHMDALFYSRPISRSSPLGHSSKERNWRETAMVS